MSADLPRVILFDLDDTLIDDSSNAESAWEVAFEAEATSLGGLEPSHLAGVLREIRRWYWSDPARHKVGRADMRASSTWMVGEALRGAGISDPDLAARIAHHGRDLRDEAQQLFPGAIETLEQVRAAGTRTALLTNGGAQGQRRKIERFGLAPYFDYICIEGEFGCGKPDERVYRGALEALSVPAQEAWMVGDNLEWDVAAPMRLGIAGIWHDRFGTGLPESAPAKPVRIIARIADLLP